jgi:rhodanese-related sulfurtransferase
MTYNILDGCYRLVDIRDANAFAEYHIPTAEDVPLATVADGALGRTDHVVLYGDGASTLLRRGWR